MATSIKLVRTCLAKNLQGKNCVAFSVRTITEGDNKYLNYYLRQHFSENSTTKMKTTKKGTCYRSPYAFGSGVLMIGTPIRLSSFLDVTYLLFIFTNYYYYYLANMSFIPSQI